MSRRGFLRLMAAAAVAPAALGVYGTQIEPFWLDVHEFPIAIKGLPASFEGFRLVLISDLHAGPAVPFGYLEGVIGRVIGLRPDAVAVCGDVVDHTLLWVQKSADLLSRISVPLVACPGNHDYHEGRSGTDGEIWRTDIANALGEAMARHGQRLLRNSATSIDHADGRLRFTGLEDWYSNRFSAQEAFAGLNTDEPVIALSHNPDTAMTLDHFRPSLILCGHTHGGQVRIPLVGAPLIPISDRRFDQGYFRLPRSQMYVSRGVGYVKRVRFCCRPEVVCLVLRRGG